MTLRMEPGRMALAVRASAFGGRFHEVFRSEQGKVTVLEAEQAEREK